MVVKHALECMGLPSFWTPLSRRFVACRVRGLRCVCTPHSYEGQWEGDLRHGEGVLTHDKVGFVYVGQWRQDKKNGEGHLYSSTERYWGFFSENKYEGKVSQSLPIFLLLASCLCVYVDLQRCLWKFSSETLRSPSGLGYIRMRGVRGAGLSLCHVDTTQPSPTDRLTTAGALIHSMAAAYLSIGIHVSIHVSRERESALGIGMCTCAYT